MLRLPEFPKKIFTTLAAKGSEKIIPTQSNDIGRALYVGRDPEALSNFYGDLQGSEDYEVYKFKAGDLKILDIREYDAKTTIEAQAKKAFPKSKYPLGDFAKSKGYDAIRYFDPHATGDEWAIFNFDKIVQTGKIKPKRNKLDW